MTTVVSSEAVRFSDVFAHEYESSLAYCREAATAYEAAETTYEIGTVLGRTLTSGTATSAAASGNTGNGAMGSVTVSGSAKIGVYTLRITKAASNAGDFSVRDPEGNLVGNGTVAVAFSAGGLAFTLADGSADFVVGDTIYISVAGTYKVKLIEATATDGSQNFYGIYMGGVTKATAYNKSTIAATTDTTVLVIARGPVIVKKEGLVVGASVNTTAELESLYSQMAAKGIVTATRIGTFASVA